MDGIGGGGSSGDGSGGGCRGGEGSNPGHMLKNKLITRPFFIFAKHITRTPRTGMLSRGGGLYHISPSFISPLPSTSFTFQIFK